MDQSSRTDLDLYSDCNNQEKGMKFGLINVIQLFKVRALSKEWSERAALPGHVVTMLNNFPSNLHPMSQFSAAIAALNSESKFAKAYADGIHKSKYWEVMFD